MSLLNRGVIALIRRYQATGGSRRWFGTQCNFDPTCSEYTRQAIERDGLLAGLRLGLARIRRCRHPDVGEPIPDPLPPRSEHAEPGRHRT